MKQEIIEQEDFCHYSGLPSPKAYKEEPMKSVHELSTDELEELRSSYYYQLVDTDEEVLGDIENPQDIPMENIIAHYEGIYFVEEDFFCNI